MIPPLKKLAIVNDIAAGNTEQWTADKNKVNRSTVQKVKTRNKELIENSAQKIINETLNKIIEQTINEVIEAGELSKELIQALREESQIIETKDNKTVELFPHQRIQAINKFLERVDKKSENILRSIGLLPAHAPAQIYMQMNVLNDNRTSVSPVIKQLLTQLDDLSS